MTVLFKVLEIPSPPVWYLFYDIEKSTMRQLCGVLFWDFEGVRKRKALGKSWDRWWRVWVVVGVVRLGRGKRESFHSVQSLRVYKDE